ncbi:hypothetical protein N9F81_04475 [Candidatus Pelagibacter sp.]|nr:hypothetical protein [Candidatus Pelagibacter sp.]
MIKKNILVISLLFFLNSCGFQPIYSKNNNVNFSIEQVDFTGDRELNNFIKTNLYQYKNSDNNKIFIEAKSEYNKFILTKNGKGEVTNYELNAEIVFLIKTTNKQIKISEKKIMESMADKFEENKYEKSIKQNFASSITFKLIRELIIN